MAAWLRTRSLAPILILLLVGELFTSACATRRSAAFDPQNFDPARLEQEFPLGSNVVVQRHSGGVDRGSVYAFRDSAVILEFRSRELVGHPDTVSVPFREIRTIQTAGPNGVGSISAIGVGLMIVTFGFVAAVVVFGVEPLSIGG
jgi:hypothetical protein